MPNSAPEKTESAPKKPNRTPFFVALAIIALVSPYAYLALHNQPCKYPYRNDSQIALNKLTINTEVVKSSADLEKGLSGRSCIGKDQAMLFVLGSPGRYSFWMKDMKFPIDIIWIGSGNKIVKIQPNVSPATYPQNFTNQQPAQYVLELKANRAEEFGLAVGSTIPLKLQ